MAKKEKPKEYHIDSFNKLVNVANKENIERLSIDLILWLNRLVQVFDKLREELPEETKGKSNSEIADVSFNWIDDGKNNIHQTVIENGLTGEQTIIDHTKE